MYFKAALVYFTLSLTSIYGAIAVAAERPLNLVGLGDSLMAGYQLPPEDALPAQLQRVLAARGHVVEIVNAGVSGDTTSGGLSRVDWSVPDGTDGVILELGANDALRGIAPEQTEKNLVQLIERLQERKISILLIGMLAPPNMGKDYADRFNAIYPKFAKTYGLPLYPFLLDGVVANADLLLEDGMHPNSKGLSLIAERLAPVAEKWIGEMKAKQK